VQGFAVRSGFAFTQGAVMSNTDTWDPTSDLFKHETIHIWQNRVLGPFFWFSYVGWMVLTIIPALIAGLIDSGRRIGDAVTWWTYFDNPWEVMAYGIANPVGSHGPGVHERRRHGDGLGLLALAGGHRPFGGRGGRPGAAFVAILVAGYG
jgi:hypothetical protein